MQPLVRAIVAAVTVTDPTATGYLRVAPGTSGAAGTINYSTGVSVNDVVVVPVDEGNLLSMFGAATIMGIILRGIGAVRLRLVARRSDVSAADLSDLKAVNRCTSFMVVGAAMCFGVLAGLTIMFRI